MTKSFIGIFAMLISTNVFALELVCEGWQQKLGQPLQMVAMTKGEQTNHNWKQSTEIEGYKYNVDWDVRLDTIYVSISRNGKSILFTTARVPTFPHNDSFTDVNLPDGLRLSVHCKFKWTDGGTYQD